MRAQFFAIASASLVAASFALVGCPAPYELEPQVDAGSEDPGVVLHGPRRLMAWNLGNFALGDGGEPARVAALVRDAGPDLLALEEIADDAALNALSAELGNEYSGVLAPSTTSSPTQRVAVLWRNSFSVNNVSPLFTSDPLFPRAVLQADVADDVYAFRLFVVHLKAGTTAQSEDQRVQEAKAIAQLFPSDPLRENNSVVIGDFNEAISDPRSAEVFAPFMGAGLSLPSLDAADAGTVTFLPAGIMLDHCAMPGELNGTLTVPRYDQSVPNYQTDVSDHLPIIIDLHILTL